MQGGTVRRSLVHLGAVESFLQPCSFPVPTSSLFQGENLLYCFEVAPTQPALTQGKQHSPIPPISPPGGSPLPGHPPQVTLPVPQ